MDDAALARLEHDSMLDWLLVAFAQAPGAVVRLEHGVALAATGLAAPFFNQIVLDDEATEVDVRAAESILRGRGAPFCVLLRSDRDDRFRPLMAELGLELDEGTVPGMALHPIPSELVTSAPGLDILPISEPAGLRDHALVAAHGFGFPEAIATAFIGDELWARPGSRVYTGYADGRPVVSGFSVRTDDTLGIYTIATEPDARGHGYGSAMTGRLIADGAAAGCTVAVLQASAMGRPIYERLGFRLVQAYDVFVGRPRA